MIAKEKKIILKNGKNCLLRSPKVEEAEEMLEYLRTCATETDFILRYPEEVTLTVEQEEQYIKSSLESESNLLITAFIDGEIAGSSHLFINRLKKVCHRGSIGIALKKKYWNLGIGTALLKELIAYARKQGCLQLELEGLEGNERAQALYEKVGFTVYGERKRGVILKDGTPLNMLLMVKYLDQ
jgi:RimJ/RimL family protein N-acetyltransferase